MPVHPRACGEHQRLASDLLASLGSSPRLRGTQILKMGGTGISRFIPAPAGNTPCRLS